MCTSCSRSSFKPIGRRVDVDQISTGEHWYGTRALDLKLVDELRTSDDYLLEAAENSDIYEVKYVRKEPLAERLHPVFAGLLKSLFRGGSPKFPGSFNRF